LYLWPQNEDSQEEEVNFNDTTRGLLIAWLHGIFPLLNILHILNLDGEQVAAIQIFISTTITLAFAVFKKGQSADPETPPVDSQALLQQITAFLEQEKAKVATVEHEHTITIPVQPINP
jgi:hypothetical protein